MLSLSTCVTLTGQDHSVVGLQKREKIALVLLIELSDSHFSGRFGQLDDSCAEGIFLLNLGFLGVRFEIVDNLLEFCLKIVLENFHVFRVAAIDR